jgi:hypothetical protein
MGQREGEGAAACESGGKGLESRLESRPKAARLDLEVSEGCTPLLLQLLTGSDVCVTTLFGGRRWTQPCSRLNQQ